MNLLSRIRSFHTFRIKEDIVETVLLWGRLRTRSSAEKLDKKEKSLIKKRNSMKRQFICCKQEEMCATIY